MHQPFDVHRFTLAARTMTSSARKLKLLLWKNYVLQKRKPLVTFFEIGSVAFFAVLLLFIRQVRSPVQKQKTPTFRNIKEYKNGLA